MSVELALYMIWMMALTFCEDGYSDELIQTKMHRYIDRSSSAGDEEKRQKHELVAMVVSQARRADNERRSSFGSRLQQAVSNWFVTKDE
jgi:hypothetical protein